MSDPKDPPRKERKEWTTSSGTVMSDCPRCHDLGAIDIDCKVCDGTGRCGLAHAVAYILQHDTDPPGDGS